MNNLLTFLQSMFTPTTEKCTSAGCYLIKGGGIVSFPIVTLAGIMDGINPCAIGMLIMLLGYLIVFAKKPERVLKTGVLYIGTIYVTYFILGLLFYESVASLDFLGLRFVINRTLGLLLLAAALINIKDFFLYSYTGKQGEWYKRLDKVHLEIPQKSKNFLMKYVEKVSYPGTVVLAFFVTLVETPCSLPLYVGTATVLSKAGLSNLSVLLYFMYYNFLFVLPLIILLVLVFKGKKTVELSEWRHINTKWMKLGLGVLILLFSFWLLRS